VSKSSASTRKMNENSNQTASQTACFSDGNKDRQTSVLPSSYLLPRSPPLCDDRRKRKELRRRERWVVVGAYCCWQVGVALVLSWYCCLTYWCEVKAEKRHVMVLRGAWREHYGWCITALRSSSFAVRSWLLRSSCDNDVVPHVHRFYLSVCDHTQISTGQS